MFSVRTPTALIEDLGTEFGVEVNGSGETASHVFAGRVVMRTEGGREKGEGRESEDNKSNIQHPTSEILLSASQSARVERDAKSGEMKLFSVEKADSSTPSKYVRRLREPPKFLDLLDIVAGGNGLGNRRERGIDPSTAEEVPVFLTQTRVGDGQYRRVAWSRLIDGVFVPDGKTGHVQLDSAGHGYDSFPTTTGKTAGSIWSRAVEIDPSNQTKSIWHWVYSMGPGERFMPSRRGLLCLHANAGITFDLEAVRKMLKDARPSRFQATAGLADAGRVFDNPYGMIDLWIFVDGRIKLKRDKLRPQDEMIAVDIEIGLNDRFLTIISTDCTCQANYDWTIFGDPVLQIIPDDLDGKEGGTGTMNLR